MTLIVLNVGDIYTTLATTIRTVHLRNNTNVDK